MSKKNDSNKVKTNELKKVPKKTKRALYASIGVGAGILVATAVTVPLAIVLNKSTPVTPVPTSTCTLTFSAGEHGSFSGETPKSISYTLKKGEKVGDNLTKAKNQLKTDDGYAFVSWVLPDGTEPTSETIVNSDLTITAKHQSTIAATVNISLCLQTNETLVGRNPSNILTIAKNMTYSQFKTQIPDAKKTGYNFKYWTLESGSSIEVPAETTFTKDTTLYPYFEVDTKKYQITFQFEALTGQTFTGSSTTNIDYDEANPTTWAELTQRPEVTEDGKVFAGWYKDSGFVNAWEDTDVITKDNNKAYAKMIAVDKAPIITFDAKGTEEKKVTWYGSQIVKSEVENPLFESIIKPIPYYDASGEPATGITTDYYFSRWVEKDENGNYSPVRNRITESMTIYPEFEEKPSIVYYLDDAEEPSVSDPIQVDPNLTWKSVVIPHDKLPKSKSEDKLFTGWMQKNSSGDEKIIKPDTKLSELDYDKETPANKPIIPIFESGCNKITFETTDSTGATVTYTGCDVVGITKKGGFFSDVNKPIPSKADSSFKNWEIYNEETKEWDAVTDSTTLPDTGETYTEFKIRPVMESTFQISFDAMENGQIVSTWTVPKTNSSTKFKDMFVPQIEAKADYKFKYWATRSGSGTEEDPWVYTQVDADQTFSKDTTLYAQYGSNVTTSIVNFHLKPTDDPTSPQYDKTGKATIAGASIALENTEGTKTFNDIPHAVVTKEYHKLKCWATKESDGTYKPIADDYKLPLGGSGLNVYAVFEPKDTYNLIKVKEADAGEYEILTDNYVYLKPEEKLTFTGDKNFGIEVKKVGYKVSGWTNFETGEVVDETTQFDKNTILEPQFEECKRNVIFSKDGDSTIEGYEDGKELIQVDNYGNLSEALAAKGLKPTKPNGDIFIEWQIKSGDVYTPITKATLVTTNLTLVPIFRGESEFAKGTQPYYFDKDKGQWAAMSSFEGNDIGVYYADGTEGSKAKATFNEKVYFGSQMTSLPYKFMEGCSNWNNGYDPESTESFDLVMPNGLTTVGDFAMAGCSSFNQKIVFPTLAQNVTFGQGFMSQCYSFNHDLDLSYSKTGGKLTLGESFMHDCYNFSSIINITGREVLVASTKQLILNTSNATSQFAVAGFKVKCSVTEFTAFSNLLPTSEDVPYRKYVKA